VKRLLLLALFACKRDHDDSIDQAVRRLVTDDGPGTQVAVDYRGQRIFEGSYGRADLEADVPVTQDTVFGIGSISKQFGAAAIMQLVEAGKLSVDDPLAKWFPSFPRAERIRIRDLLRHTSGIEDMEYTGPWPTTMAVSRTDDEVVALFADRPALFEPNHGWSYSTSNYILLGMIVSKVSGVPLADYLRDHVFAPAGLRQTRPCDPYELIPHRARPYEPTKTGGFAPARMAVLTEYGIGGELCSTSRDLLAWQKALVSGRVVSPASYKEMTTPQPLADGTPILYGYGLCVGELGGHRVIGHSGGVPGYSAELLAFVDDDLVAAGASNGGQVVTYAAARQVLGIANAVAVPITTADLAKYSVTGYLAPGNLRFEIDGDHLVMHGIFKDEHGWDEKAPLVHVGHDTFESESRSLNVHFTFDGGRVRVIHLMFGSAALTMTNPTPL